MATIVRFEDLDIWKEAKSLSCEIIQIVNVTELKGDYKLRDQIKGSSGSVMDNIAEGFERDGNLEFRQFLSVAKGSAGETRSQIYRVYDSGYISEKEMIRLTVEYEKLSRRIANFITYLNKKDFKGIKFK
ncbi:four helix bundle protein [Arenibacter palladensis]|uniref:Four helix bundle protein n=1 Tax=Arenibacter palladensis TaxID=237373 RepID=A0A1M4TTW9_9FLAO|nr:four helix bundle protein [Arenibacter palladensis]SHE47930.1 four helix bundle protein [Arenibacter palladensis]